jgi:hypothetical protein
MSRRYDAANTTAILEALAAWFRGEAYVREQGGRYYFIRSRP